MWCTHCRQDVPGIVAPGTAGLGESTRDTMDSLGLELSDDALLAKGLDSAMDSSNRGNFGRFVCARCGEAVGQDRAVEATASTSASSEQADENIASPSDAILRFDTWEWELDQQLHDARRLLQSRSAASESAKPGHAAEEPPVADRFRIDQAHGTGMAPHPTEIRHEGPQAKRAVVSAQRNGSSSSARRPSLAGWTILAIGVMILVCGGVLMGWSVATARAELWGLGLPLALGGQATMFIGLLLVLERMWREGRRATEDLDGVHDRLDHLHRTTLAAQSQPGGDKSYYVHAAEGAPPTLLLADLKGQLDHLAEKLAQH